MDRTIRKNNRIWRIATRKVNKQVCSLSWADLVGAQLEPTGALVDAQVATELDLDELRDDVTTISLTEEELPAPLSPQTSPFFHIGLAPSAEYPLPTRSFLSKLSVYRV